MGEAVRSMAPGSGRLYHEGMPHPPWSSTWQDPVPEVHARRSWRARVFFAALSVLVQLPGLAVAIAATWHLSRGFGSTNPLPGARGEFATSSGAFSVAAVALGIVAALLLLLPSRRSAVVAVAALAMPAIALAPGPPMAAVAVAVAAARAVFDRAAIWTWCSLAGMGMAGIAWILVPTGSGPGIRLLASTVVLCVVAAAATGASTRRERFRAAAREATARRRSAAEEERLRIARDLHDVLAHSLSQISVQAGVGLHLFDDDPASAKRSLRSIRETSTTALDEVRAVLGVLRDPEGGAERAPRHPEPMLSALPALLEDARALGMRLSTTGNLAAGLWNGEPPVPAAIQTAAFRIVQEGITNARRHADGAKVRVHAEATAQHVTISVENGPATVQPHPRVGGDARRDGGRGLVGMRERAAAFGGTLETESSIDGGFRVMARLPLPSGNASATPREGTAS